jgi:hypothetical protein
LTHPTTIPRLLCGEPTLFSHPVRFIARYFKELNHVGVESWH